MNVHFRHGAFADFRAVRKNASGNDSHPDTLTAP